ncbi:hypothetical protein O7614_26900 [Micromonospora sp. WMMD961]|uniref:hypothetical protein n=1 Tax=Micromonospora sp. WMMD961 TaxID=3016100 RepID=UPI002417AE09|nr:hypothetical protein [Micromonospora sp. WMMD961]MDG4783292.1 hypothetical protein [Micromonospora sp. WMMD961]
MSTESNEQPIFPPLGDILIVGWLKEAAEYPQFGERDVFSANVVYALQGRRARNIYVTDKALAHPNMDRLIPELDRIARFSGGEIRHVSLYWEDQQKALSDQAAAILQPEHVEVAA